MGQYFAHLLPAHILGIERKDSLLQLRGKTPSLSDERALNLVQTLCFKSMTVVHATTAEQQCHAEHQKLGRLVSQGAVRASFKYSRKRLPNPWMSLERN